jgi:predicted nucleic acid-binding protein
MTRPLLIDSDVLVWFTRGHAGAAERLRHVNPWRISIVTYLELAQGCRNLEELARLKRGLASRHTVTIPITPTTCERAAALIDGMALSHGLRLADALIAATAVEDKATLITGNVKHFGSVPGLTIEAFAA